MPGRIFRNPKTSFSRYQSYTTQKKRRERLIAILLALFLIYVGYLSLTAVFLRSARWGSVSMEPTLKKDTVVLLSPLPFGNTNLPFLPFGIPGWRGPERGELVQIEPPFHQPAYPWVAAADDLVRFLTFNLISIDQRSRPSWDQALTLRRVIALPGDTVKMDRFTAYVKPKNEAYFLSEYELSKHPYGIKTAALPEGWRNTLPFSDGLKERVLGENEYFVLADNRMEGLDSRTWGLVQRQAIKAVAFLKYWPLSDFGGL